MAGGEAKNASQEKACLHSIVRLYSKQRSRFLILLAGSRSVRTNGTVVIDSRRQIRLAVTTAPGTGAGLAWDAIRVDDDTRARSGDRCRVATQHSHTRAEFGASEGDHMFANMAGNLLALMMVAVHQDPLNQVIAVLITRDVDQGNARSIRVGSGHTMQVLLHELCSTNLEALLNHFRGKLVNAVAVGVVQNMIDDASLVRR